MAINWSTQEPCACCGIVTENGNAKHHVLSRKAYREFQDEAWNCSPLCLMHHNMIHSKGISEMAKRFPGFKSWLELNGWEIVHGAWKPKIWQ